MGGRGGAPRTNLATAVAQAAARAEAAASPEAQIRQAYDNLPKGPAGYVGLADLRDQLSGVPRDTVDAALRQLSRQPDVHISPVANRRSLTPRDRAAMLRIGEDENFMISIDRNS